MNELDDVVTGSVARRISRAREIVSLVIWAAARSRSKSPVCTETFVIRNCRTSDTDCARADDETVRTMTIARVRFRTMCALVIGFGDPRRIDRSVRPLGSCHAHMPVFLFEVA